LRVVGIYIKAYDTPYSVYIEMLISYICVVDEMLGLRWDATRCKWRCKCIALEHTCILVSLEVLGPLKYNA
jgi:hypothetical protein